MNDQTLIFPASQIVHAFKDVEYRAARKGRLALFQVSTETYKRTDGCRLLLRLWPQQCGETKTIRRIGCRLITGSEARPPEPYAKHLRRANSLVATPIPKPAGFHRSNGTLIIA